MLEGYWVSPLGEVLSVGKTKTHISIVIQNPQKFGESIDSIQKEYDKYNEQLSWEGKAREVVMTRIIKRGWIRIRERARNWVVQVWKSTEKANDILWMWAKSVFSIVYDKYAPVVIYELSKPLSTKPKSIDFNELEMGKTISENYIINIKNFKFVNDVNSFTDLYTKVNIISEKYLH